MSHDNRAEEKIMTSQIEQVTPYNGENFTVSVVQNGSNNNGTNAEVNGKTFNNSNAKKFEAGVIEQPHQIFFYVQIAFFAMCGCLARVGTDKIFGPLAGIEDPGEIVNQSFFSNMIGCFVLGALNGSPMGTTSLAAMYKGLTTGFCGSFTTWSKWNQQLSLTLIGETDTRGAQSQVLSIVSWFVGFHAYIGSYQVGMDFGRTVGNWLRNKPTPKCARMVDRAVCGLLALGFIGFSVGVAVDSLESSKGIWMAVLFAPFGACLRAYLSKYKHEKTMMPLGTFYANVLGAVILSGLHVANVRSEPECSSGICWLNVIIYALGTGFCACLTTISTFMSEIVKIRGKVPIYGYGYCIFTVFVCQILCGIINGINSAV